MEAERTQRVLCIKSDCLEPSWTGREGTTCRKPKRRALSTARHWKTSGKWWRLRSTAGSGWLCRPGLVVVPWLVRALAARTFESFDDVELFCVGGGRRKYGESVRGCAGWNETSWEWSSREDRASANACWAAEDRPGVTVRTMRVVRRAVRWTFEWRRRKSATGCDED